MKYSRVIFAAALISCCASAQSYTPAPQSLNAHPAISETQPTKKRSFAERAQLKWITFTDTHGRKLVAEVIRAQAESLQIRRQIDSREMELPLSLLCDDDKAFAQYLLNPPKATLITKADSTPVQANDIMDRMFQGTAMIDGL